MDIYYVKRLISCLCFSATIGKGWGYLINVLPKTVEPSGPVTIFERSSLRMYCGSTTLVNWTYIAFFTHTEKPIVNRHSIGYNTVKLSNLNTDDSGRYYCHGTYKNETFKVGTIIVVLYKVAGGVKGYVVPSWIEVSTNSTVTLTCGSEKSVEWFSLQLHNMQKRITLNMLTLHNIQVKHSGRYICRGVEYRHNLSGMIKEGFSVFHSSAIVLVDGIQHYIGI